MPSKNASFKHAPKSTSLLLDDLHNTGQMFTQRNKAYILFSQ